jgi:pimeloyl-ACP methyl ester carboxylesterase
VSAVASPCHGRVLISNRSPFARTDEALHVGTTEQPSPPGRLVDVGTHRLHLHCRGDGSPAVVFDAALGASSLSWSLVQPSVARITRACSYDRAGFGWSERGPLPRTAGRIADELHTLLDRSAIAAPYILVGHSFGGLVMRLYAARHAEDVAALVLIEPAIPEQWSAPGDDERAMLARGEKLCRYGARAARLGLARVVAALVGMGALGAARAIVALVSRGGLRRKDEGILAPIWKLPPEARAALRDRWTAPEFFEALGSQIQSICESALDVMHAVERHPLRCPLVVITAATADEGRMRADEALARSSPRGQHLLAPNSGHWVPLDAPQTVIDAISDVVADRRRGGYQ